MNKIQEIRKQIGLTQEEMSTKLGISQQAYGAYEKEGNNIPSKMIDKIAEILKK
ncbi:MAG: helix-turn-helix transcriptional regulator [Bacilli bacterium]|nr:helix-turn-helix transcriptional regulator [Bacilli bacterium]